MYGGYGDDSLDGVTDEVLAASDYMDGGANTIAGDTAYVGVGDTYYNCEVIQR